MKQPTILLIVISIAIHQGSPVAAANKTGQGKGMQYGPCLCHSVTFVKPKDGNAPTWEGSLTRGMIIDAGSGSTLCYDLNRMKVSACWEGGFLDLSKTHHQSYKGGLPPRPAGTVRGLNLISPGWMSSDADNARHPAKPKLKGYYLHGTNVILSYEVQERNILELPASPRKGWYSRTLRVSEGESSLSFLIGTLQKGELLAESTGTNEFPALLTFGNEKESLYVYYRSDTSFLSPREDDEGNLWLDLPSSSKPALVRLFFSYQQNGQSNRPDHLPEKILSAAPIDPQSYIRGGAPLWSKEWITAGVKGSVQKTSSSAALNAYVIDDFPLPEDPWNSWMRPSAIDFFSDGRLVFSTLNGDVWILSWKEDEFSKLHWRRFATGLYEPLGLKVVNDKIYVRGRDRITRLHDLNDDGEADFYENFHSEGEIGPGYHAFLFDLVTDKEGNFYFTRSGRKAPSQGEVVKVSPDGKKREMIALHFRHPNGLGAGGPDDWILVADNPDGKFPSGANIVKQGEKYGHNGPRTIPMLYVVSPKVDSSTGSLIWTDPKRFGPLSGTLIHTSYSHANISYSLVQKTKSHPNGFNIALPFAFKSGIMRGAVNPLDGQLYLAGLRGWDNNSAFDGCIQRVRYTGKKACLITKAEVMGEEIHLTFSEPLDPVSVTDDQFYAERSLKTSEEIYIDDVTLKGDQTVIITISEGIEPEKIIDEQATKRAKKEAEKEGTTAKVRYRVLPPLAIEMRIKTKAGNTIKETIYCTINAVAL